MGRMGEKVQGIRNINGRYKIDRGRLRIGSGEAKELTCMTHGHGLKGRIAGGNEDTGQRGGKGRIKWDNSNSIINKIDFKNAQEW